MAHNTTMVDSTKTFGDMYARIFEVEITNYDEDGSGDGEAFGTSDTQFGRFWGSPRVQVTSDTGYVAHYDASTQSIRLYESAGAQGELSEVASDGNHTATVEVEARGW